MLRIYMYMGMLAVGIALLVFSYTQIDAELRFHKVQRVIIPDTDLKFDENSTAAVSFTLPRVNDDNDNNNNNNNNGNDLAISVGLFELNVKEAKLVPLAFMLLVDEDGMTQIRNNETLGYAYLSVKALETNQTFIVNNVPSEKKMYLLMGSPIPAQQTARVGVVQTFITNPDFKPEPLVIASLAGGAALTATSAVLSSRKRFRK